jgi:hypothetical protein
MCILTYTQPNGFKEYLRYFNKQGSTLSMMFKILLLIFTIINSGVTYAFESMYTKLTEWMAIKNQNKIKEK